LRWIIDRCAGRGGAVETPIGEVPRPEDLDLEELPEFHRSKCTSCSRFKSEEWAMELQGQKEFLASLGSKVPKELMAEHEKVAQRFNR
jgi:phosphoenolpyruvate carboxykinase (GTP)